MSNTPQKAEKNQIEATRDTIIEVLSWAEDLDTGRWGYDRAAALLDGYVHERVARALREHADREVERGGHGQSIVERLLAHAEEYAPLLPPAQPGSTDA